MNGKCAWCGDELGATGESGKTGPVTHGLCASCRRSFFGRMLDERDLFLDTLDVPVLVFDGEAAACYANRAAETLLGKNLPSIRGFKNGDVFECVNARLPGGCGRTDHCGGCLLRHTLEDTYETGMAHKNVPTLITRLHGGRREVVRAVVSTEKAGDFVLLKIESIVPGG